MATFDAANVMKDSEGRTWVEICLPISEHGEADLIPEGCSFARGIHNGNEILSIYFRDGLDYYVAYIQEGVVKYASRHFIKPEVSDGIQR
jgi:hypothetical protein